jgi:hypothetical protein
MTEKHIESFAKYAGLVTISLEWLAIILFYVFKPAAFNGENPISYFASFPETRAIFSICLTIAAISFWIFSKYHLPKYYRVPERLFAASMIGYALLALTPFNPYNATSSGIHQILALFFSVTYLAGIYLVGRRNPDPQVRIMSYSMAALSLLIMVMFFVVPPGSHFVFPLEAASALVGQIWVVWISLHSFKLKTRHLNQLG